VGRRMMGGQSTHMPLKVNAGGVIPVIFASSLLAFPMTLVNIPAVANSKWISGMLRAMGSGEPLYVIMFIALIVFFSFFYVSIIFNPNEAADNMRRYGGFIPGIRPGKNTADYMNGILSRITVGVAMDTVNQVEAQLIMRHYEGFTPRAGRIRGRRSSS